MLNRISDHWTGQKQRHLLYVAEFTSDIRHIHRADNVVADALSGPAAVVVQAPGGAVDFGTMAEYQKSCLDVKKMREIDSLKVPKWRSRVQCCGVMCQYQH